MKYRPEMLIPAIPGVMHFSICSRQVMAPVKLEIIVDIIAVLCGHSTVIDIISFREVSDSDRWKTIMKFIRFFFLHLVDIE